MLIRHIKVYLRVWILLGAHMRAASFAEKLLRAVLGKQRAAAAIGDLVEIGRSKGIVWFWLSVSGCLIRTLWRPVLGVVVVLSATNWALNLFVMTAVSIYTKHLPSVAWQPFMNTVCALGALMCGAGFYSAICYGFFDRFTQFALVLLGLSAMMVYGWWIPGVQPAAAVFLLFLLAYFSLDSERRWAILTASIIAFASVLTYAISMFVVEGYRRHFTHGRPTGGEEFRAHPALLLLAFLAWLATAIVLGGTCSYMHKRFKRTLSCTQSSGVPE